MRSFYATRTRRQIVDLLGRERRYLSATSIFSLLRKARAKVSLSTVYRTLDWLVTRGTASTRADAQGESTYILCKDTHHHHAICRKCARVEEVDCGAMERFASALRKHHGFRLIDHSMEFFGLCSQCK